MPDKMSPECRDLVHKMLQKEPADRLPLVSAEAHTWMQDPASGESAVDVWRERDKFFKFGNDADSSGEALSQNFHALLSPEVRARN
jgi:serine/threonine protein kinase